ncbi:MAG: PKD domain-containing protein [Nitrospinae bacterium]|nr:PKD domain-containing protein [Nitrospinota bacterium]
MSLARGKGAGVFAILFWAFTALYGCSASLDQEKGGPSGQTQLELVWPSGYDYDPATQRLTNQTSLLQYAAPVYVTRVNLTVSGSGMDPISIDLPLDTLATDLTLTFGDRRFDVTVQTNFGASFTGSQTVTVAASSSPTVRITLEVNAPPQITSINTPDTYPSPGQQVTITGYASDPDPEDTLTYTWYGFGPYGESRTFTGQSITTTAPLDGGHYVLSLVVEDGKGGVAQARMDFYIYGSAPVINSVNVSNSTPQTGETVTLSASASDSDPGDILIYNWTITSDKGFAFQDEGQSINFTVNQIGSYTATVAVRDLQDNVTYGSITFGSTCTYPTPQMMTVTGVIGAGASSAIINVTVEYPAGSFVSDGIAVFNLTVNEFTAAGGPWVNSYWVGGVTADVNPKTLTYNCQPGKFYSFQASAGNTCYVAGSPSTPENPTSGSYIACP